MVKFLEFGQWTREECAGLIELVKNNITVPAIRNTEELITKCNCLPRHIKDVLRESYQTGNTKELDSTLIDELLRRVL